MSKRFIGAFQTTIADEVHISGVGVHKGTPVHAVLHPAPENTGLRFLITQGPRTVAELPAHYSNVRNLTLCTVLGNSQGATISTVEHLLAALRGLAIDNCLIEIDGNEVPIMDGSSAPFVDAIDEVGIRELSTPRSFIQVLKPIRVVEGDCWGEISPYQGFHLDLEIEFTGSPIGRQQLALDITPAVFRKELSRARTFGFMSDVERLWKAGLALGANLSNTVAIGEGRVINREGLRDPREFVRHKMLDALGDLSLSGHPLLCSYRSVRGGHRLNSLVLQALFADPTAWTVVESHSPRETHARVYSNLERALSAHE